MPTATVMSDDHGPYLVVYKALSYGHLPQVYRPQPSLPVYTRMQVLDGVRHPVAQPSETRFPPGTKVRVRLRSHDNRLADVAGTGGSWRDAEKENWFGHSLLGRWHENRSNESEAHWRPA